MNDKSIEYYNKIINNLKNNKIKINMNDKVAIIIIDDIQVKWEMFNGQWKYVSEKSFLNNNNNNNSNCNNNNNINGIEEIKKARINKINEMRESNVNPFEYSFTITHKTDQLHSLYSNLANGEESEDATFISIAGRIMFKRIFGKLVFFTIQDGNGSIQLYLDKKRLGDSFKDLKDWADAGDIIGVTGTMKKTQKGSYLIDYYIAFELVLFLFFINIILSNYIGELSIYVNKWTMLTKSVLPLPDKYHGLQERELRYRQRHLDLIVNPEVKNTFKSRSFIISSIRKNLDKMEFLEIETPILNNQPGGAEAKPFQTYHNSLNMNLTLRIATGLNYI
jgi:lysyl-tRNA synthetase class 2